MNVGELRRLIIELPNDMPVVLRQIGQWPIRDPVAKVEQHVDHKCNEPACAHAHAVARLVIEFREL